jgi:hypothetical protein
MRQNVCNEPPTFAERAPEIEVPAALEAIVRKMITKTADERYASAQAALDALDELDDIRGGRTDARDPTDHRSRPVRTRADSQAMMAQARLPTEIETTGTHFAAPRSGRRGLALGLAVLALGLAVAMIRLGRRDAAPAVAIDAAPTRPPVSEPTPALAPVAVADAGAAPAIAIDAAPAKAPGRPRPTRPPVRTPPKETPTSVPAPRPTPTKAPGSDPTPPPIATDRLVARYRALGARIDVLERTAPEAAAGLRKRYFAIPLADAIRRPEMRAEIVESIAALERKVGAAER